MATSADLSAESDSDRTATASKDERDVEGGNDVPSSDDLAAAGDNAAERMASHATSVPAAPAPVPDGGLEAWLQVLGSWVVLVDTWGLINCFGVYQTFYETDFLSSRSSSDISWIGSLQAALLMVIGVVSGPLYDAGYFRELLMVGLFLIVFGQFMTSLCTTYTQVLLAQGICIGIGMGLTFLPSAAILSQYFQKRRALVLGLSSTGSPLAGIIFPIIFSRLEPTIGFGWATRVIGFILLGISVIPLAFMHTRVPPNKKRSLFDETAFKDVPFLFIAAATFFSFLTLYVPFFYITLFADKHGLWTPDMSPYLVTLLNAGSVFGRVLPSMIADKWGGLNMLIASLIGSAVLALGWFGIHGLAGLIVFALLYGMFSGGVVSLVPTVLVSSSPDMGRVGARMGIAFVMAGLALLVGTPICGAILGDFTEQKWLGAIGYAAGSLVLACILFITARILKFRETGNRKM